MKILQVFIKQEKKSNDDTNYFHYFPSATLSGRNYVDSGVLILFNLIEEAIAFLSNDKPLNIDKELIKQDESLSFNSGQIYLYEKNWYKLESCCGEEDEYFITRENFVEIFIAWQTYMIELPNYIIITREDNHYSITSADNLDAFESTKK